MIDSARKSAWTSLAVPADSIVPYKYTWYIVCPSTADNEADLELSTCCSTQECARPMRSRFLKEWVVLEQC